MQDPQVSPWDPDTCFQSVHSKSRISLSSTCTSRSQLCAQASPRRARLRAALSGTLCATWGNLLTLSGLSLLFCRMKNGHLNFLLMGLL